MSTQSSSTTKPVWQEKKLFLYPQIQETHAILLIAATTVAMTFLGTFLVIFFYALWLPYIYYKGEFILRPSKDIIIPLVIAIYGCVTLLWSDHKEITARGGLEFLSLIICTIIISRITTVYAVIKGLTVGVCLVLVIMLIKTRDQLSAEAIDGLLGSKNQVGAIAEIGVFCACLCWLMYKPLLSKIFFSLMPSLFCLIFLFISHSATSDVSLVAMFSISFIAYILTKFPKRHRALALTTSLLFLGIIITVGYYLSLQDIGLNALGKDTTLTGRTYLWSEGLKTGMQNPFLGVGVGAFWQPGRLEAEKLWYEFDIFDRKGFHFHNLFVEVFVSGGLVGLIFWVWAYLFACFKSTILLLKKGSTVEKIFYIAIAFMYFVRAFTEVDTTEPYGVGPVLFFYIVICVSSKSIARTRTTNHRVITSYEEIV